MSAGKLILLVPHKYVKDDMGAEWALAELGACGLFPSVFLSLLDSIKGHSQTRSNVTAPCSVTSYGRAELAKLQL